MLMATQGTNVAATRQYFETVLTQGDYYLGQEVGGQWHGQGALLLGLDQGTTVTREQFASLLAGKHPVTGINLTQRNRADRRPGVDLTFSVPKSVSLAWGILQDERIVDALKKAVHDTMERDVEPLMMRRVRDNGRANTSDRTKTGKLIYADFLHKTSRPVEGKPDPHLHIHAFVINWTEQDGKHYAGEFEEIIRQRPSLQAKFEARLARTLERELGYRVERTQFRQSGRLKSGWEISGISRETIEKFSRRTEQVEEFAQLHGITNAAEKGRLGKKTREKKDAGTSIDQLRDEWLSRLNDQERETFGGLVGKGFSKEQVNEHQLAEKSLQFALEHHLFRQSTVERHQVIGTALEQGVTVSPEQMEQAFDKLQVIQRKRNVDGADRELVTTKEILTAEQEMIAFARDGRGTRKAIGHREYEFSRDWLNEQQKDAVRHVLTSRDTVTAITGGAGTGKTSLMQEAVEAVWSNGNVVHVFAPSTGARDVLQEKGFQHAQTVEHLLRNDNLQQLVKNQVLWIDEAGLLDLRSMCTLFRIAKEQNARVILSGDTRQHASPRRGEALRLLEKEAGLNIARVETIQRQKGDYQQAVKLISQGHEVDQQTGKTGLLAGFDLLDQLGKIKEVSPEQLPTMAAEQALTARDQGKSTLVVAPTHKEGRDVTAQIRDGLRQRGVLSEDEQSVKQLVSLNLSEAQKGEPVTYLDQDNLIVQFHQNVVGGFNRGERWRVAGVFDGRVELTSLNSTDRKFLPADVADRFEVYRETELKLSIGDQVRFTLGGTAHDSQRRIANGRLDEIKEIDPEGHLILKSGMTVHRDYGHLDLGYVITSHASQGKDRNIAIAAMGSDSLPAINAKQFYVTVSRGSEDVAIYVDNKARIRRAIERSGEQLSATELVKAPETERSSEPERSWEYERPSRQSVRERFVSWFRDRVENQRERLSAIEQHERDFGRSLGYGSPMGLSRS
ncbi:MobF family relaxase [Planctomicrobium sp. SH664]|uniref:MobF family relaxase n=1 Tax=Planctomicrobium sp. SH664 TaxID=3448125 RepID=UPI003F5B93C9